MTAYAAPPPYGFANWRAWHLHVCRSLGHDPLKLRPDATAHQLSEACAAALDITLQHTSPNHA